MKNFFGVLSAEEEVVEASVAAPVVASRKDRRGRNSFLHALLRGLQEPQTGSGAASQKHDAQRAQPPSKKANVNVGDARSRRRPGDLWSEHKREKRPQDEH